MTTSTELQGILQDFLAEARENLVQFESALVELEAFPKRTSALQALFRAVHSIKGSCGFFGLTKVESLTHVGESLLDQLRSGRASLSVDATDALLEMVDAVRRLLAQVDLDGTEGGLEVEPLIEKLARLAGDSTDTSSDFEPCTLALSALGEGLAPSPAQEGRDGKVRVETVLLERIMNLVGELVLARNQLIQHPAGQGAQSLTLATQRLSAVTSELQEVVMKTRMQPIGLVFSRFPRVARDIAKGLGKRIRLEVEGRETELDKTLLEAIQDPLTHLVRNAIGHGIESPAERKAHGKPPEGIIRLRAFHESGMVNVEVSDDGAGLDLDAVRRAAVRQGIVDSERAARMPERELSNLVFLPGFTTQAEVTSVAGRGVGMDVVKTNIERIGGTIDLHSERGRGTTLTVKIPLTLAIIPALLVVAGGERFAIPQASLLEVVRLHEDEHRRIELIRESRVLRVRGKILPLVYLSQVLGLEARAPAQGPSTIVVLQAGERSLGLVVDDVGDTEEIVVKPLWKRLRGLGCYAGAAVMGDGRVVLILEPLGLSQRAGVAQEEPRVAAFKRPVEEEAAAREEKPCEQVLLCRTGSERLAIQLSKVARLEHLPVHDVEQSGGTEVAQYRGQILPLVRVSRHLQERRRRPRAAARPAQAPEQTLPVVVYSDGLKSVGLVVDAILDVVDLRVELQRSGARHGVLGSMVVQGWVTEFLDVEGTIRSGEPTFYGTGT